MSKIFISYRREDSESITGRIFDHLVAHFGEASVVMDIDNIPLGSDFRDVINEHLRQCKVMTAIVGTKWHGPKRRGPPRISEESDWVRVEVETALRRQIPLIPILVHGAEMPKPEKLPDSLRDFAFKQAAIVNGGQDFKSHVERVIRSIGRTLQSHEGTIAAERMPARQPSLAEEEDAAQSGIELSAARKVTLQPAPMVVRAPDQPQSQPEVRALSPNADGRQVGEGFDNSRDRHLFSTGPKRVLALDGGGVRSILTIAYLERIEEILDQQEKRNVRLSDWFDLIGGTSTGGLVATALAFGQRIAALKQLFVSIAPRVFRRPFWRLPGFQPKFNWRNLHEEIEAYIGDRSLGSSDLKTGLCLVIKRMDTGQPWLITNNPRNPYWNTPEDNSYIGSKHYRLANLVRASTAAPGLFDPVEMPVIAGAPGGLFVDGSISLHNNPSLALFYLTVLSQNGLCWRTGLEQLSITSIGSGTYRPRVGRSDFGIAGHLKLALHSMMSLLYEADDFVQAQMQWLGDGYMPWPVRYIGGGSKDRPLGGPHFRLHRYDVRLDVQWLAETLDMKMSEREFVRLRQMDDPAVIPVIYEIGRRAAEQQVKPEHFTSKPPAANPGKS
jgi:hypothetical protein